VPAFRSADDIISPELLCALRAIAPKRRHPKLPYLILLAVASVAGAVWQNHATREFVVSEWSRTMRR
jgi:hypothetical protein